MATLSDDEFEGAIADALDALPEEFSEALENIVVMAADEPTEEQLNTDGMADEQGADEGDLLGLYEGVSLDERADGYGYPGDLPDMITIFKGPHERLGLDRDQTLDEVRRTVIHELGHYFGMDEDQIAEMGYE